MAFGERLQEIRKTNGLSQEQLAEKCNITRQSVSKWELGQGYPETEKLLVLCRVLNVDLDYLMQDEVAVRSIGKTSAIRNPYHEFLGKWATILFYDKECQGLPFVAIVALSNEYVMFENRSKKGLIRISDIRSIYEAKPSKKQSLKLPGITPFELLDDHNPYLNFMDKKCLIRFRRGPFSAQYFGGYNSAQIKSIAEDTITIQRKSATIIIKTADILMIMEE